MDIRAEDISRIIRDQIGSYAVEVDVAEVGSVISIGDGIARVHGLERAMAGEMIEFPHEVFGIALNLEEDSVGAVLLGDYTEIKEGDTVKRTGRIISVPVGNEMLGRVVNALGQPIDGKGPILTNEFLPNIWSPTGTEMMRPVRLTRSPSLIALKSPSSTAPTLSSSRLSAMPNTPRGNSSISPAMARSTPCTRAMPSPIEITLPTSATSTWTA